MKHKTTIIQSGGGWPTNIGNAFLELGSIYTLRKAVDNSIIVPFSSLPKTYLSKAFLSKGFLSRAFQFILSHLYAHPREDNISNVFDVREATKPDYFVLSGALLNQSWLARGFPYKLLSKDVKIIINGGGGLLYTRKEFEAVNDYLRKIKPYAFISRDEITYKHCKGIAEHSFNGIDTGFFINNYFTPLSFDLPNYITITFDQTLNTPKINSKGRLVVRTHHSCWPHPGLRTSRYKRDFLQKNTLISDLPQDYLNIYANTEEIHSDRVHACVPTIVYGKPARLYNNTPRANLFDRIGLWSIKDELTYPNLKKIETEKNYHIKFLSEILNHR